MPCTCACVNKFSVEHALSCAKGGFPSIRYNEIRNLTATLLIEVCHAVCIEPGLQPIPREVHTGATANNQDGARLDIAASGFWGGSYKRTYFDVRIFNSHAPSNRNTSLPSCYRKHKQIKKGCMNKDAEKWNMLPLHHWCCQLQEGLPKRLIHFKND